MDRGAWVRGLGRARLGIKGPGSMALVLFVVRFAASVLWLLVFAFFDNGASALQGGKNGPAGDDRKSGLDFSWCAVKKANEYLVVPLDVDCIFGSL